MENTSINSEQYQQLDIDDVVDIVTEDSFDGKDKEMYNENP